MDGMTATIGHNSAGAEDTLPAALDAELLRDQLALDHAALITKRDEHIAEITRWFEKFPAGPTNDDEQGAAGDMVKEIKNTVAEAVAAHKRVKAPYWDCGKVVDAVFTTETVTPLKDKIDKVERAMGTYARMKADRERREAQAAAAAAASEAQRLADIAAAEANPIKADTIMERAEVLADRSEAAATVAASSTAALSRTRGAYGSNTSLQDKWTYRVDDLMALVKAVAAGTAPIYYLTLNDSTVGAAVRPKNGVREIPGLTIYNDAKARVR